jgi:hypothetical protein
LNTRGDAKRVIPSLKQILIQSLGLNVIAAARAATAFDEWMSINRPSRSQGIILP